MEYFLSALIGYLLGSIPTGYLILKKFKGINITENGSTNVGTMNSYRISNSKRIALAVFLVDYFKGFLSVLIVSIIYGDVFLLPMIALIFAVLSHCYSPWIKFKGGRGLATAAGGATLLSPQVLALWVIFFALGYLFRKNVHFACAAASILTGAVCLSTSEILARYSTPPASSPAVFGIATVIMFLIILTRHIEPLKEYYNNQKNQIGKNRV